MPRPRIILTEKELQEIESMAGIGLTQEEIASVKGISVDSLRKYAGHVVRRGKAKAIAMVAETLFKKAIAGNMTAIIFYLKTQAKWSEHPSIPSEILKALDLGEEEDAA